METGRSKFVLAGAWVSDRRLPVCAIGTSGLTFLRSGTLETWLRSNPDQFAALLRGEDVLAAHSSSTETEDSVRLIPIIDSTRLQGLMVLDIRGANDPPADGAFLCDMGAALLRALHELEDLREKNYELQHQIESLRNDASELAEQRLRLEDQLQTQGNSLSSTVHDLRTPLTAVRGFARMLLDTKLELSDAKRHDCQTVILENANRLVSLVDRLALSINSRPPRFGSMDILELWRECMVLIRPLALRKSIEFVEQLPADPLVISGDQEKLTFVLHKLLSNAVNVTDHGSRIEAEVLYGPDKVAVQMQGPADGIPLELVEKAFGCPHNSVEETPQEVDVENRGASLVHDIVRLHRGRLWVTGGTGQAWNVVLVLPVLQQEYCLEAHAKAQRSGNRG